MPIQGRLHFCALINTSSSFSALCNNFGLAFPIRCTLSLFVSRQAIAMVDSLAKPIELDWLVTNYNTLNRRQHTLTVLVPARRNANGLHLLVDSTGI